MCFSSINGGIKRYKIININNNNEYVLEDESKRKQYNDQYKNKLGWCKCSEQ